MKPVPAVPAVSLLLAAVLGLSLAGVAPAQPKPSRPAQEFMREKLGLTQKVLEGITLEDFALVEGRARRLAAMSLEPPWQVMDNPDYTQHSLTYRRQAEALARAAAERNLDAATLAYVRLTMSCVDCHKFVRGKRMARAQVPAVPVPTPGLLAAAHLTPAPRP
ncbi:MAG: hypothetical protein RJA22_1593 [Verrucomicrobiota bacterium]|jgi:cytochrome c556